MSPHVFGAMDSPSFLADCHSFSCCHLCAKRKAYTVFFRKALLLISELLAATEEVTRLDFTEVDTAPRMMRPQAHSLPSCVAGRETREPAWPQRTTCRPRQHGELFPAFCKTLAALAIRGPTQGISP